LSALLSFGPLAAMATARSDSSAETSFDLRRRARAAGRVGGCQPVPAAIHRPISSIARIGLGRSTLPDREHVLHVVDDVQGGVPA
jgi:hypothetical protein